MKAHKLSLCAFSKKIGFYIMILLIGLRVFHGSLAFAEEDFFAAPNAARFEERLERIRENVLGRMVDLVIQWRYAFVGIVIGIFILSVGMLAAGILKFKPFPDVDGDLVQARILLPQGTPLAKTEALVGRIVDAIHQVDEAEGRRIVIRER